MSGTNSTAASIARYRRRCCSLGLRHFGWPRAWRLVVLTFAVALSGFRSTCRRSSSRRKRPAHLHSRNSALPGGTPLEQTDRVVLEIERTSSATKAGQIGETIAEGGEGVVNWAVSSSARAPPGTSCPTNIEQTSARSTRYMIINATVARGHRRADPRSSNGLLRFDSFPDLKATIDPLASARQHGQPDRDPHLGSGQRCELFDLVDTGQGQAATRPGSREPS